jgi:hypothetical protein
MRLSRALSPRTGDLRWWAYPLCAWMTFSALAHVYAIFIPESARGDSPWGDTAYLSYNVLIILMSIVGGALALAVVRPWGEAIPRFVVLWPLSIGSAILALRGIPGGIEAILVSTGLTPSGLFGLFDDSRPEIAQDQILRDVLINGYFLLGAVLLIPLTVAYYKRTKPARTVRFAPDLVAERT